MPDTPNGTIEIAVVDERRFPDLVRLMEGRGGPRHCWCLAWREPHKARRDLDLAGRREAMASRARAGTPLGLLAYVDGEPRGWCSVAPRDSYIPLGGDEHADETVWSIVCFFLHSSVRRRGLAPRLLDAAVEYAAREGADVVEAYPVDPDSPSYRHMGFVPMFERAGFVETRMEGSRRHVMYRRIARR